jgi:hypothetical protein
VSRRALQLVFGRPRARIFRREDDLKRLTNDFRFDVPECLFRTRVPSDNDARGGHGEHRIFGEAVHQKAIQHRIGTGGIRLGGGARTLVVRGRDAVGKLLRPLFHRTVFCEPK